MSFEMPEIRRSQMIPNRIGLIDGDVVAYWASAGCDDMPVEAALRKVDERIDDISDQIQTDNLRIYLTGSTNFRNDIATIQQYKGNRYDADGNRIKPQPRWLKHTRKAMIDGHHAIVTEGIEADDALGIAQTKCNASPGWESIISSVDKDLKIIPGMHHDMNSGYYDIVEPFGYLRVLFPGQKNQKMVGTGVLFFYAQLLMGDAADWIPGLPKITQEIKEEFELTRCGGCGPMAAFKILADCENASQAHDRVLYCYSLYWNGERHYTHWRTGETIVPTGAEAMLEQGRLLWIWQKENDLWQLPKE